ncbi:MAG: TIGR03790 family protein [Candidatus Firestonebacteria bacterium]
MNKVIHYFLLIFLITFFVKINLLFAIAGPENVLVIVNDSSADSKTIGDYYKQKRNIPDINVLHYTGSTTETVNETTYNSLVTSIRNYISTNNLSSKIDYIVLTKGTPLRATIGGTTYSSCNWLVAMDAVPLTTDHTDNPYNGRSWWYSSSPWGTQIDDTFLHSKTYNGYTKLYLVTRLDGYTVDQVKVLIDNSVNAGGLKGTSGKFLFDAKVSGAGYIQADNAMTNTKNSMVSNGYSTIYDNTSTFLTGYSNLMGYVSWGSNAGADFTLAKYQNLSFMPGSIGETYVSSGGRTFNLPTDWPNYSGQSLIADLVKNGITGVSGYVAEPYLDACLDVENLFARWTKGYNLAESFYMAVPYLNWMTVIIGDPLCSGIGTPNITDAGAITNSSTVTFTWSKGTIIDSSTITSYYLQVGTTKGGNDKFDGDVGNVLSKVISGCEEGKIYYARVCAKNTNSLYSPWSYTDGINIDLTDSNKASDFSATPLVGRKIQLRWLRSTSSDANSYRIYMSTGNIDYSTPVATVSHPTELWIAENLQDNQLYYFAIRTVDLAGNEEQNTFVINAVAVENFDKAKVEIKVPKNEEKVGGKILTVVADIIYGNILDIKAVKFEYKRATESVWALLPVTNVNDSNPDTKYPYYIHWDISGLQASSYNLRAVGTDKNNIQDNSVGHITFSIDTTDLDIEEDGNGQKKERIDNRKNNLIQFGEFGFDQLTQIIIPLGLLSVESTRIILTVNPKDAPAYDGTLGFAGEIRKIELENNQKDFASEITLTIPYKDNNNDGVIDGTRVKEKELAMYSYNDILKKWEKLVSNVIDKENNAVTSKTTHFSYFGLFAPVMTDLVEAHVYPNPFKPSLGHTNIYFTKLTDRTRLRIFNVAGELIYDVEKSTPNGEFEWNAKNSGGENIASGVYIYMITNDKGHIKKGKLAIIR